MTPSLSANLRDALVHLRREGTELSFDTAMVLTGGAFRHYFFTPDDNHAWRTTYPDDFWHDDTLCVENYGLFEAMEGQTGWGVRRWTDIHAADFLKLLRQENGAGRALRIYIHDDVSPTFLNGVDVQAGAVTITGVREDRSITLQYPDLTSFEAFVTSLREVYTLRPARHLIADERKYALTRDVFVWAQRHWRAKKEILYDVQAYYAAGDRAWGALKTFVETNIMVISSERHPDAHRYVQAHLHELALARHAASQFFSDDARVAKHTQYATSATDLAPLQRAWSDAYKKITQAAEADDTTRVSAIDEAHRADARAFSALASWVDRP